MRCCYKSLAPHVLTMLMIGAVSNFDKIKWLRTEGTHRGRKQCICLYKCLFCDAKCLLGIPQTLFDLHRFGAGLKRTSCISGNNEAFEVSVNSLKRRWQIKTWAIWSLKFTKDRLLCAIRRGAKNRWTRTAKRLEKQWLADNPQRAIVFLAVLWYSITQIIVHSCFWALWCSCGEDLSLSRCTLTILLCGANAENNTG